MERYEFSSLGRSGEAYFVHRDTRADSNDLAYLLNCKRNIEIVLASEEFLERCEYMKFVVVY